MCPVWDRLVFLILTLTSMVFIATSCNSVFQDHIEPNHIVEDSTRLTVLHPVLATTVLQPGSQRVSFLLTNDAGLVTTPHVTVSTYSGEDSSSSSYAREITTAKYIPWPHGRRGNYVSELYFDGPGIWKINIETAIGYKGDRITQLLVKVTDGFGVVDVGTYAPKSVSKTLRDVPRPDHFSSAHDPDPELYSISIAEALTLHRPTLIVFDSPAFCTSPTCGPQLETVIGLKEKYRNEVTFIHVEIFDNPHEVREGMNNARISHVVQEWGLTTIPDWNNASWVFLLDEHGKVNSRFESYVSHEELEHALVNILE